MRLKLHSLLVRFAVPFFWLGTALAAGMAWLRLRIFPPPETELRNAAKATSR